jgi:hypothetical protein
MMDNYGDFPRRPQYNNGSNQRGRNMPVSAAPVGAMGVTTTGTTAGAMHYDKDTYVTEKKQKIHTANGDYKETEKHKHNEIDAVGVGFVDKTRSNPNVSTCDPQPYKKTTDESWGCMWIVWVILIFIIILIIVIGALWFIKPDCVTKQCDDGGDGGCEVDLCKAALYAFVITFFIVLIGCCIWWCVRR